MAEVKSIMTSPLQIVSFGDDLGIVLSEELLAHCGIASGDELILTETVNGFELTSDSIKEAAACRRAASKYNDVLRRLAE
jgi:hypothetical protein